MMGLGITLLLSIFALTAAAQFTVAPFGSGISTTIPIGEGRKNQCSNQRCSFELVIRPFCFGTNLRAYPEEIQLDPTRRVIANVEFSDPKDSSVKDSIEVSFPGSMTYDSAGAKINCVFKEEEDMTKEGNHQMACFIPWLNQSYTYTLKEWLSRKNPDISWTSEFISYAGIGLPATLDPGQTGIDEEIMCLYKFSDRYGPMVRTSVSCYFPSTLQGLSSEIKVRKDGVELSDIEVSAFTNAVRIKFKEPLKSLPKDLVIKHGNVVLGTPPSHVVSFSQPSGPANPAYFNPWAPSEEIPSFETREIRAVREREGFDESNAYQSFTTQIKFPGVEGFCGGYYSPLMLFFDEKVPKFRGLSTFPLYGMKEGTPVNWPERNAPGHFLVLLKNRQKKVTSYKELFGKTDTFRNGFEALRTHDLNQDDVIDRNDQVYSTLFLWNDANSNGHSERDEIKSLRELGVSSISLKYTERDLTNFGNRAKIREKGKFTFQKDGKVTKGDVFDVWFAPYEP